jgi:hypothetical protein
VDDVADWRRIECDHGDYSSSQSRISFHLYSSAVKPPRIGVSCSSVKGNSAALLAR